MAKKYKVITIVISFLLVLAIFALSVSASSYISTDAFFLYGDTGDSVMNVAEEAWEDIYIYTPYTSFGFFHDLKIEKYHTYTVDVTLEVEFPDSGDEVGIYPLPGEFVHASFHDSKSDVSGKTVVSMDDIKILQRNSSGELYSDLISMSFDSFYNSEKELTELNYHLSFCTSDGFIDNLSDDSQYLFTLFDMHPDAPENHYTLCFWHMAVTSSYDPDGDIFEDTIVDNLGDAVNQLNSINSKLSGLQNSGSTQIKHLEALKAQTEALVTKTTELFTTVDQIFRQVSSLPKEIGDEFSDALVDHDQELLDSSITGGNELMEQLTEAIGGAVDANGVIDSMGSLINVLSYEGRKSEFRIPEMSIPPLSGVTSEPIQLMAATSVDFADYVDMIPESIMTLIQWGTVVIIVNNAVLTTMRFINQFLQGKSVGGEEGD